MASRLNFARLGAGVVGASVAVVIAAIPASADPATGVVDGGVDGYNVNVGGNHKDISTSLIGFKLSDGTKLGMYCVEINTRIDREHDMVERPWDDYPVEDSPFHENRDKINWVLHHGFPVADTDALTAKLESAGAELNDGISEKEAIAATQAAVWHFSDNVKLNENNPLPNGPGKSKGDVVALYKWLTGADNTGIGEQPGAALEVSPATLSGKAGERIGPFTVKSIGAIDELVSELPEGVKLTDKDGAELTADKIANGTEIFFDVPADAEAGAAGFQLSASASQDTGRLFVGKHYGQNRDGKTKKTQSLIVAQSDKSQVTAKAGAQWEAAPVTTTPPSSTTPPAPTTSDTPAPQPKPENTGGLADTGASIFAPILIGVVLVGAGVGAILFQRNRRRA